MAQANASPKRSALSRFIAHFRRKPITPVSDSYNQAAHNDSGFNSTSSSPPPSPRAKRSVVYHDVFSDDKILNSLGKVSGRTNSLASESSKGSQYSLNSIDEDSITYETLIGADREHQLDASGVVPPVQDHISASGEIHLARRESVSEMREYFEKTRIQRHIELPPQPHKRPPNKARHDNWVTKTDPIYEKIPLSREDLFQPEPTSSKAKKAVAPELPPRNPTMRQLH